MGEIKVPTYSGDLVTWGKEAWKFLQKLKTMFSVFKKSSNYDTTLKELEEKLRKSTENSDPSTGLWVMSHDVFNNSVFSKTLHKYCKNGVNTSRVKKVEALRKYYKEHVEKEIADLITGNNKNMVDGTDGRGFDGFKVLVFRGKVWEQIPPKENDKRFQNLKSLKKLVLGPEVQKIGAEGFKYCKNLKTIEVEGNSQAIELEKGAFEGCGKNIKILGDEKRTEELRKLLAGSASLSAPSKSKSARKSRNGKS